jgi:competence protein ComEA
MEPLPDHEGGLDEEERNLAQMKPAGRHRRAPRVLTVPVALRGAQIAVSWRSVLALALLLVVAGLFFVARVAWAERAAAPVVYGSGDGVVGRTSIPSVFVSGSSDATGTAGGARASPDGGALSTARAAVTKSIVVDVVGQVARPGVVSVPDGSRVVDVLAAVGGALPGADIQRLNLARSVSDGEQLFVPRPGEAPPAWVDGAAAGGSGPSTTGPGAVVNLNTATLAVLDELPGVGPVLAQRILDWRAEHGRFSSVDELGEVSGIGDKLLAQIRPRVRV